MPSTVRTARAPTDLKPNLIRVKKRDDERARIGRWRLSALSKRTGQTPLRSLSRKENGKARTWMNEKSVRKSHGHHIPPAKGMGERALLLLGLLSLLTAADEVCHADAQHRATSDPSEGHAVKAGERELTCLVSPTVILKVPSSFVRVPSWKSSLLSPDFPSVRPAMTLSF